jgi:hypothetical protein
VEQVATTSRPRFSARERRLLLAAVAEQHKAAPNDHEWRALTVKLGRLCGYMPSEVTVEEDTQ